MRGWVAWLGSLCGTLARGRRYFIVCSYGYVFLSCSPPMVRVCPFGCHNSKVHFAKKSETPTQRPNNKDPYRRRYVHSSLLHRVLWESEKVARKYRNFCVELKLKICENYFFLHLLVCSARKLYVAKYDIHVAYDLFVHIWRFIVVGQREFNSCKFNQRKEEQRYEISSEGLLRPALIHITYV